MQPKYENQLDDNYAICPYCNNKWEVESEDYSEDSRKIECDCGKKYYLHESFSITHHTDPNCELNGEQHQFERIKLNNGKEADFCIICDQCRVVV